MRMMMTVTLDKNILPRDYRPWISQLLRISLTRQGGDALLQQYFGGASAKPFSFSVYLPKSRFGTEITLECDYIKVIFSAFDENVFDDFFLAAMGIQGQQVEMGENTLRISSVVRILEKSVANPQVNIHMLSPLVVHGKAGLRQDSRGCLGVRDPDFEEQLRASVAQLIAGTGLSPDLLKTLHVWAEDGPAGCKEAHVLHRGRFYRSTLGNLKLSGEPALLNLLYHAGMGEMREEGFGLFELAE